MDYNNIDQCEVHCIHEDIVQDVSKNMINDEKAQSLADIFKTLGDPTRIKLIYALMQKDLCVCDIAAVIGASQSAVSHQLRLLRNQKLVKFRREGKNLYYSLDDDHVRTLFSQGLDHVNE